METKFKLVIKGINVNNDWAIRPALAKSGYAGTDRSVTEVEREVLISEYGPLDKNLHKTIQMLVENGMSVEFVPYR